MRRLVVAAFVVGCATPGTPFDRGVLTGSVVRVSRTEIEVASDFADSASTRVRGVDGVALGWRVGDRVRIEARDESVGKTDPLDWDCGGARCEMRRE